MRISASWCSRWNVSKSSELGKVLSCHIQCHTMLSLSPELWTVTLPWCSSPVMPLCHGSNHTLVDMAATASWCGSGIVAWVWCHGIMARVQVCAVVSQHPSCGHPSSMRFHWPWAHTNCLPDLIILVSTPWTPSSLTSPRCTPSPWPDASGAKKMQWVQRYVQRLCMNIFLFMVCSLPPFSCLDLQGS